MNVADITIAIQAHEGFYFDRHGYDRPCILVTADGDPMYAIDAETQADDLDPEECFAITDGSQA